MLKTLKQKSKCLFYKHKVVTRVTLCFLSILFVFTGCSACANNANDIATSEVDSMYDYEYAFNRLKEYSKLGKDLTSKKFALEDFESIEIGKSTIFDVYEITGGANKEINAYGNYDYDYFLIENECTIKFTYSFWAKFSIIEITISDKNGNIIDKIP